MRPMPMLKVEEVPTGDLLPYAHNAKIHTDEQVSQIANSISEFGFNDPVGVWDGPAGTEIVEGHGRVLAAQRMGIERVPVVRLDHLTDNQRRAYAHAHNQLTMSTGWDFAELEAEMARLPEFDFADFGFEAGEDLSRWFGELSTEGRAKSEGYDDFVEKFEPKLTTDDCYTPKAVYDAVLGWASAEYGFDPADAVRPFYPGGDYEAFDYPEGCVVVDNPPFSILAAIVRFYMGRGIPFFLFAPALTPFTAGGECRYLPVAADVTYENGAKVRTSFVTSMGEWKIDTAPGLREAAEAAQKTESKELPKIEFPPEVVTAMSLAGLAKRGVRWTAAPEDCRFVRKLDAQVEKDSSIFGGGFLISERAAAERAAAERAAAERAAAERAAAERAAREKKDVRVYELSERERAIVDELGR